MVVGKRSALVAAVCDIAIASLRFIAVTGEKCFLGATL
jgi:hypothetical protein